MSAAMSRPLFNCLLRTHHITSRKKLQRVRRAADQLGVDWVLVRSGGAPGVMFAEARSETGLADWVAAVQALRYKDFRCVARPARTEGDGEVRARGWGETASLREFGEEMEARGLGAWWKRGMGYS